MSSDSERPPVATPNVRPACGCTTRWRRRSSWPSFAAPASRRSVSTRPLSVVYGLTVDGFGQQDIMVRAEDLEEARTALEVTEEPDGEE